MIKRLILSVVAIIVYGIVNGFLHPMQAVLGAQIAGRQFESNDLTYIQTLASMNLISYIGIPSVVLLAVLLGIWWKPIKEHVKKFDDDGTGPKLMLATLAAVLGIGLSDNANAYFDKVDTTEVYTILPNETAFWVPTQGDRAGNQAAMNTEAFYVANKVSALMFKIPHFKLTGYNFVGFDPYVPAGRLIIVDHIAYHREWTADPKRGTEVKNQAIPCQSSEGLNMTVEVSLTVSIKEADAAKYLYNFGVAMPANIDRSHPETMFQSVYHAKPLDWVMDNIGRGVIVNVACDEISSRPFDRGNGEAKVIMQAIANKATAFLKDRGITVDSIGWAGTFEFDPEVQKAVNDAYIGNKIAGALPVLRTQADIKVKEGMGEGFRKGVNFVPAGLMDLFNKFFGSSNDQPASPPAKK